MGPDDTIAPGDVVVTEQNAKRLSQPRAGADGKSIRPELRGPVSAPTVTSPSSIAEAPGEIDPAKRKVRTVGPTFLPTR
jgi:hypothetical protein